MKGLKARKAQSVLEYVIILTVIVAAIIAGISAFGINTTDNSVDKAKGLGKLLYDTTEKVKTEAEKIGDMVPKTEAPKEPTAP